MEEIVTTATINDTAHASVTDALHAAAELIRPLKPKSVTVYSYDDRPPIVTIELHTLNDLTFVAKRTPGATPVERLTARRSDEVDYLVYGRCPGYSVHLRTTVREVAYERSVELIPVGRAAVAVAA